MSASNPPRLEFHGVQFTAPPRLSPPTSHNLAAAPVPELLDRIADAETADHLDQINVMYPDPTEKLTMIRSNRLWQLVKHYPHRSSADTGARRWPPSFTTTRILRMADAPEIEVKIVADNTGKPAGIGDAGLPSLAPAIADAVFAAAGQRLDVLSFGSMFS